GRGRLCEWRGDSCRRWWRRALAPFASRRCCLILMAQRPLGSPRRTAREVVGAAGSPSFLRFAIARLAVDGNRLAAVDEVFELLFVLIRVTVRLVAQDAPLLDVVVERGARVARGAEPQQARGLGGGQRAAPAQQIEQLRREKGQSASPHRQGGELDSERGDERKVQLARAVEKA